MYNIQTLPFDAAGCGGWERGWCQNMAVWLCSVFHGMEFLWSIIFLKGIDAWDRSGYWGGGDYI